MCCMLPTIKINEKYDIISNNNFTTKKNLTEIISFEGNIMDYNETNVISCDDPDVCYKLFCLKEDKIITVILVDISKENMKMRQTSHDLRNVGNTINSFLYLSKKIENPKMLVPKLEGSLKTIINITKELDKFATRKKD